MPGGPISEVSPWLQPIREGEDIILVARPTLPGDASTTLLQSHMAGGTDYTVKFFDESSSTPTTDLFSATEEGTAATAGESNFPQGGATQPVVATAIVAPTDTYGTLWDRDDTGYVVLFVVLLTDLSTAPEGGHVYKAEMTLTTTDYGVRVLEWRLPCSGRAGT